MPHQGRSASLTPRRSQEDRSRATRAALVEAGRRLFAERGYAAVSAEELVAAAGVTRGALVHHYGGKQGLFEAVLEEVEVENTAEVQAAMQAAPDLMSGMLAALGVFLDLCQRPDVVRITISDGPAVLGWQRWRELEAQYGLGLITDFLGRGVEEGIFVPAPVATLAQLVLSAILEAGMIVAHADDPPAARADAEQSLMLLLAGFLRQP